MSSRAQLFALFAQNFRRQVSSLKASLALLRVPTTTPTPTTTTTTTTPPPRKDVFWWSIGIGCLGSVKQQQKKGIFKENVLRSKKIDWRLFNSGRTGRAGRRGWPAKFCLKWGEEKNPRRCLDGWEMEQQKKKRKKNWNIQKLGSVPSSIWKMKWSRFVSLWNIFLQHDTGDEYLEIKCSVSIFLKTWIFDSSTLWCCTLDTDVFIGSEPCKSAPKHCNFFHGNQLLH